MPRFYRHIRQGSMLLEDPEGVELPDLDAARAEAVDGIRDIIAGALRRGNEDWLDDAIVIADEGGRELVTVPFTDALPSRLHRAVLAAPPSTDEPPSNR